MTSVSDEIAGLQEDEIKEMKKQLRELRKEIEACKLENGALQQKNEELKSENVTLTSIIEELTDQICAKPKRISDLGNFTGLQNPENVCYIRKMIKQCDNISFYFTVVQRNGSCLRCRSSRLAQHADDYNSKSK